MAGTGIGTFNDRLRDAVRGGGPFDGDPRSQGFGIRAADRPERRPGERRRPTSRRTAAARTRTRSRSAWPATWPTTRSCEPTATGQGRRRRLQRPAGRLHRRPAGGDHLRRGARQRDAVRRARVQAAAARRRWPTGCGCRTCRDEHGRCSARACRSSTPAPSCCARSRWTATATTPATGSTGSTSPTRPTTAASGCRRGGQRVQVGLHAAAARRPGPRRPARAPSRRPTRGCRSCCGSGASSRLFRLGSLAAGAGAAQPSRHRTGRRPASSRCALADDVRHRRRPALRVRRRRLQRDGEAASVQVGAAGETRSRLHPVQALRRRPGGQDVGVHVRRPGRFTVPARTVAVFVERARSRR